jgi:hypothetical protein
MEVTCFFCGSPYPKYKFPHPPMRCHVMDVDMGPGYFLACIDCTILFEDHKFTDLIELSMRRPEHRQYRDRAVEFRLELASIYNKIVRKREPAF